MMTIILLVTCVTGLPCCQMASRKVGPVMAYNRPPDYRCCGCNVLDNSSSPTCVHSLPRSPLLRQGCSGINYPLANKDLNSSTPTSEKSSCLQYNTLDGTTSSELYSSYDRRRDGLAERKKGVHFANIDRSKLSTKLQSVPLESSSKSIDLHQPTSAAVAASVADVPL